MGARYRRKYTVLRHWLIHKSETSLVRLKAAEPLPDIDLGATDIAVFRDETQIGPYKHSHYGSEYLYAKTGLPAVIG